MLEHMAKVLRGSELPGPLGVAMERHCLALERLAEQVDQPCVVAVVGRVKNGKSTFINALLQADLAVVGPTETTATINYFRYDRRGPAIRCYWRDREPEEVDQAFVDRLQGHSLETLRLAEDIDRLEYRLDNPTLRHVTLVDTPGTGAVVAEHGDRTTDFVRLDRRLRQRHHEETETISGEADAIVYLVGAVAIVDDQTFLELFNETLGSHSNAFNALGVMSKVDLDERVLARRHELAATIAGQFRRELNTVLPISAALERALDPLRRDGRLTHLIASLRRIPDDDLSLLLSDQELFCEFDGRCAVNAEERQQLLGSVDWPVFTTVARVAADAALSEEEVAGRLRDLAGMGPLRQLLEQTFFQRGPILRCHRILRDAEEVVRRIRYHDLNEVRRQEHEDRTRRDRFAAFLRQAGGDAAVQQELEAFIDDHLVGSRHRRRLDAIGAELEDVRRCLFDELAAHNSDFQAWQQMRSASEAFTDDEHEELRALFGIDRLDVKTRLAGQVSRNHVRQRMMDWRDHKYRAARGSARHAVAEQAEARYGLILAELRGR